MNNPKRIASGLLVIIVFSTIAVNASSIQINAEEFNIQETINTGAENEFTIEVNEGIERYEKISSDTRLEVVETPENNTKILETDNRRFEVFTNSDKELETVETPRGTLETGFDDGRSVGNFKGQEREKVEEFKNQAEEIMSRELRAAKELRQQALNEHLVDINFEINRTEGDTYYSIQNNGVEELDLQNWLLEGKESETSTREARHLFNRQKLNEGEALKIYTGDENQIGEDENYIQSNELHIYNEDSTHGDRVVLYDDWGNVVKNKTY